MMSFYSLLLKKKDDKTKKRCHFDCTIHLLLPLDALQGGEKGFFPSFAVSLSLSLSLSLSISLAQKHRHSPHPLWATIKMKKQRGQALRAALG
jgi:hypothetical protein